MNWTSFGISDSNIDYRKLQERLCRESSRLVHLSYTVPPEQAKELIAESHKLNKVIRSIQDLMRPW